MKLQLSFPELTFEAFSTVLLWCLGLAILVDDRMLTLPAYIGFPNKWWMIIGLVCLAGINTYCLTQRGSTSRFCAGFVMMLAALGWGIISAQIFEAWPPLTLGMVVFPLLFGFCFLVSLKNIHESRATENADMDNG